MATYKFISIVLVCCFTVICECFANTEQNSFSRYEVILKKQPFGKIVPPDPEPITTPQAASFARDLQMTAIVDDGYKTKVCFRDRKEKKSFYISQEENIDGMELVSVDYESEEAILRKENETVLFSLKQDTKPSPVNTRSGDVQPVRRALNQPKPFFSKIKNAQASGSQPPEVSSPFQGQTIQAFLESHPEAANKYPSPIQPGQEWEGGTGRGKTIDEFLEEYPEAIKQFSPIQIPQQTQPAEGKGKTIEEFLKEHSDKFKHIEPNMPASTQPNVPQPR
jgi:hypothetical protein